MWVQGEVPSTVQGGSRRRNGGERLKRVCVEPWGVEVRTTLLLSYRVCCTIKAREMNLMASLGKMDLFGLTLNIHVFLATSLGKGGVIDMMNLSCYKDMLCR